MPRFSTQLSGSHVLVTGGTKGIGRAIVETFLSEGANVSYCARTPRGDEFASFEAADGARAIGTSVDISGQSAIEAWVEKSAEEFGRIDVVVANASPLLHAATKEAWEKSFQADILGLIALIDAATPHLEKRGGTGSIVVVSSLAGFEARERNIAGPYGTLKRAQATLAKDYARKLGRLGVRINSIAPGTIETPSATLPDGTKELSTFQRVRKEKPEYINALLEAVPLGRTGTVEEVANVVVFLGSRLSAYVCGANLIIDGGMSIAF
ncbi:hypothetical protein B0T10DRAFT_526933 [Thelonectria olida]|uniref:Uncharacterized protein n=1 Tax=Thelonectria olida TaxID=1576542 RepID=A0A9P8WF09_9HYPO|nr:hypothetical protein B0T10DRAFT_526933 [Thelonectria olida]